MNTRNKTITIHDTVSEAKACGYAGFSPTGCSALRNNVPHTCKRQPNGTTARYYLVSDCIEYKRRRESRGALTPIPDEES